MANTSGEYFERSFMSTVLTVLAYPFFQIPGFAAQYIHIPSMSPIVISTKSALATRVLSFRRTNDKTSVKAQLTYFG
jgi:hypothetical protein